MPATINGIGTRYSGKKELLVRQGVCGHCGKPAELSSYDTRLWFCFVFIPVIPLARKRIVDDCSRCRRHQAIPLDEYRELQTETLTRLGTEARQNPTDVDKALEYNSALREFGRLEEAEENLGQLLRTFKDDAQAQFYAGAVCEEGGRLDEAARFYALSFQIDSAFPPARRAHAQAQIAQGNLEQASSLLSPSSLPLEETDPGLLFALAQAYRERGDHVNAMELDQRLIRDFPGIDQGKEFRQAVKRSEKALPSAPGTILAKRQLPWGRWAAIGAVAVAVVGGAFFYNEYRKAHREVHIVNAFPGEVAVSIDGEPAFSFSDVGRETVELNEGAHSVVASGAIEDAVNFEIVGDIVSRHSDDTAYVVNLGGLAVLLEEVVTYAERVEDVPEPEIRMLAGDSFAAVRDVDYLFRDFPEEITLPSGSSSTQKKGLSLLEGNPEDLSGWLIADGGPKTTFAYAEAWLDAAPSDALALTYSGASVAADETSRAAERLRPGLTFRPTNLDWHRAYQHAASVTDPDALLAEYDGHLAADPADPDFLYLRGRIDPDPRSALAYYDRALAAAPRHRHAMVASGTIHMSLGNFSAASSQLRAGALDPASDPEVVDAYVDATLAAGNDDEARRVLEGRLDAAGTDFLWADAQRLALLEIRSGHPERADALAAGLTTGSEDDFFAPWIHSQILYATRDIGALGQFTASEAFPYLWRAETGFWVAVENADLQSVAQFLREIDSATSDGISELIGSVLFARSGMDGAAEQWEAAGLTALTRLRPEAEATGEILSGERPLTRQAVDLLELEPAIKAPVLAVLATRFPADRDWLLAEAERYSYLPQFPHHFLRSLSADTSPAPARRP